MKRTQAALLGMFLPLALLLASCGAAPSATPAAGIASAAPAPDTAAKTFMWEATHPDLPGKSIHLLGSVHAATEEFYPLAPVIEEAFEEAEIVLFELAPDQTAPEVLLPLTLELGMLPEGETLEDHLSPETHALLQETLADLGIPADRLSTMRPWLVATNLSMMEILVAGLDPSLGIDNHFTEEAEREGKEIAGLETARGQLTVLAGMSGPLQEEYLRSVVEELGEAREVLDRMVVAWQSGDAAALDALMRDEIGDDDLGREFYDRFIVDRNVGMATGAREALEGRDRVFVVVGAGHLVGDGSVVELLAAEGFEVEQVPRLAP